MPVLLASMCDMQLQLLFAACSRFFGKPGDIEAYQKAAALQLSGENGKATEDVPGVPAEAWVRVQRGIPPTDPFNPGDQPHAQ